jgi:hypothetical protein
MPRPSSEQIQEELLAAGTLTPEALNAAAWDVLHFLWSVSKGKGKLLVQWPGDHIPSPVTFSVPGLIEKLS